MATKKQPAKKVNPGPSGDMGKGKKTGPVLISRSRRSNADLKENRKNAKMTNRRLVMSKDSEAAVNRPADSTRQSKSGTRKLPRTL